MHTRPPSADNATPSERDGAYNVRSVPVRVYLPDGPVLQDLVPPVLEDGSLPLNHLFINCNHYLPRYIKHARTFSFNTHSSPFPFWVHFFNAGTSKLDLHHDLRICVRPHSRGSLPSGG